MLAVTNDAETVLRHLHAGDKEIGTMNPIRISQDTRSGVAGDMLAILTIKLATIVPTG